MCGGVFCFVVVVFLFCFSSIYGYLTDSQLTLKTSSLETVMPGPTLKNQIPEDRKFIASHLPVQSS